MPCDCLRNRGKSPLPAPQSLDLIVKLAPFPFGLTTQLFVVTSLVGLGLPFELPVVLQAIDGEVSRLHRFLHRATRFRVVPTVSKAALCRERLNVLEYRIEALFVDKLQFSHSRRVEQKAASRQQDELAMCRDMATTTITRSNLAGGHPFFVEKSVNQGRFAGP